MEPIDTLAKAIVQAQDNAALAGFEVAERVGISTAYYSDLRKGKRIPSPELIQRLAEVLHMRVEPLLWLWVTQHMDPDQTWGLANWLRGDQP